MRLTYLTTTHVPGKDAQSIQIAEMIRAFQAVLGAAHVRAFTFATDATDTDWNTIRIGASSARWLRYIILICTAAPVVLFRQQQVIYTRDVGICFFFRNLGVPCVYEMHKPFETRIGEWLFRRVWKRIRIVAISEQLRSFATHRYGIPAAHVCVAHDAAAPFSVASEGDITPPLGWISPVALYTGSFQPGKGVELVLAIARLRPAIQFFLIGGGIPSTHDVPENVHILPRISQHIVRLLQHQADVLLLPMTSQLSYAVYSSPLKLFEYMQTGVPIVASDIGAIAEVLTHGKNAYLADPTDISVFAQAIDMALKDPSVGAQAKKESATQTWQRRAEQIVAYISSE